MPAMLTYEEVESLAMKLPTYERLRLAERLLGLTEDVDSVPLDDQPDLLDLAGVAPNLLGGEDAQAWVKRLRSESETPDENHREIVP